MYIDDRVSIAFVEGAARDRSEKWPAELSSVHFVISRKAWGNFTMKDSRKAVTVPS